MCGYLFLKGECEVRKRFKYSFIIIPLIFFNQAVHADAIYSILNALHNLEKIQSTIASAQVGMLKSQLDIEELMKQVNSNMSGSSGWGTYKYHDYQSYGDNAKNWSSVMQLAEGKGGSGALGQAMGTIGNQFPIDSKHFNQGIGNVTNQKYYAVQSQTILATRAASQLDYDKIQDQISYQKMLQQQIEKAKDLKGAVDLNNRIQVESNLINLEVLRQSALANQQHAISEQGNVNAALFNAKFLTK